MPAAPPFLWSSSSLYQNFPCFNFPNTLLNNKIIFHTFTHTRVYNLQSCKKKDTRTYEFWYWIVELNYCVLKGVCACDHVRINDGRRANKPQVTSSFTPFLTSSPTTPCASLLFGPSHLLLLQVFMACLTFLVPVLGLPELQVPTATQETWRTEDPGLLRHLRLVLRLQQQLLRRQQQQQQQQLVDGRQGRAGQVRQSVLHVESDTSASLRRRHYSSVR